MLFASKFYNRNLFLNTFPAFGDGFDIMIVMALIPNARNTEQSILATQTNNIKFLLRMDLTK